MLTKNDIVKMFEKALANDLLPRSHKELMTLTVRLVYNEVDGWYFESGPFGKNALEFNAAESIFFNPLKNFIVAQTNFNCTNSSAKYIVTFNRQTKEVAIKGSSYKEVLDFNGEVALK
jgi:hypothetical protein